MRRIIQTPVIIAAITAFALYARGLPAEEDYVAVTRQGEAYWDRGDRAAAARAFARAVKIAPDYAPVHFLLGRAYFFERKYKKAVDEFGIFKEKMGLIPGKDEKTIDYYVSTLHDISFLYSSLKRYDLIAKECKEIIGLRPRDQAARFNLAVCYYRYYRNRPKAYIELKSIMDIDDTTPVAKRAEFLIEFIRNNPDPRFEADFSFIFQTD